MRIEEIHLEAFGCYTDYRISFGDTNRTFHLLYGSNEAGKSTLLRGLTNLFYEIPANTMDAFFHMPNKLRIGGTIQCSDGRRCSFYRRKGNKNTLMFADKQPMEDSALQSFLGGVSKEAFTSMFALNHETLRMGGESLLRGGGNLGESLFEAAAGIHHLNQVLIKLDKATGNLFSPKASKPIINQLLSEHKKLKEKTKAASLSANKWLELKKQLSMKEKELLSLKQEIRAEEKEQTKLERILWSLPFIAKRKTLLEGLNALGQVVVLPAEFTVQRMDLSSKLALERDQKERLLKEIVELEQQILEHDIPQELILHADLIVDLHQQLSNYRTDRAGVPQLEAENRLLEDEMKDKLLQLQYHGPREQLEKLRIQLFDKERMRQLASQYYVLEQQLSNSEKQLRERSEELEELAHKRGSIGEVVDIQPLEREVADIRKLGDPEANLEKEQKAKGSLEREIELEIEKDPLWSGTVEEAERISIPLSETLDGFQEQQQQLLSEKNTLNQKIKELACVQKEIQDELEDMSRQGQVPTEQELLQSREVREQGWELIRRSWLDRQPDIKGEQAYSSEKLDIAYQHAVEKADEVSDLLRIEAERVARYEHLIEMKKQKEQALNSLYEALEAREKDIAGWNEQWQELWRKTGIQPLSPKEMKGWCYKHAERLLLIKQWRELVHSVEESQLKLEDNRALFVSLLSEHESNLSVQGASLSALLRQGERILAENEKRRNDLEHLNRRVEEVSQKLRRSREDYDLAQEKIKGWSKSWTGAISKTSMPETLTVEMAAQYIQIHDELFARVDHQKKNQWVLEQKRMAVQQFEDQAREFLAKIEWNGQDFHSVEHLVTELYAALQKAQRDVERKQHRIDQLTQKKQEFEQLEKNLLALESKMHLLVTQASCEQEEQLQVAEERSQAYCQIQQQLTLLEQQLLENGAGLTIQELIEETDHVDRDLLPQLVKEREDLLRSKNEEKSRLDQEYGVIKYEFEKLNGESQEALIAAEEGETVIASLRQESGRYIRYQLAASILRKAIDDFREKNQHPILQRASYLFNRLTLGSFAGLSIGFDSKDTPVIVGIRENGEQVGVEGMSDGTQDQLYLALRIANVEKYATENEPMPLILDDILVHFDDQRSKETLRILAEISSKVQVIYFTHHAHLVGLAKEVVDQNMLDIHRIHHRQVYTEIIDMSEDKKSDIMI
ncbi:YhaN family protein [Ammoniphilus resinae]|uniref:Uncharacterized protein YhaN n=1 Tax=Ammoniphilus resinae TaxID=861532 RepID=A0ABS4GM72_9BACL|nr:YhaN family protein [Ammoniphilus resinae]MBP1931365.1 uncharacterized protein YhaN [Ammoniphilus resinae]